MALNTNLTAYWSFEGNSTDATGNSHNGTDTNVVYETGKIGLAANFNPNSNSNISIPSTPELKLNTFSISFWSLNIANELATRMIFQSYNNTPQQFGLQIYKTGWDTFRVDFYGTVASDGATYSGVVTPYVWEHYVVTFDSVTKELKTFKDGAQIGTTKISSIVPEYSETNFVQIGSSKTSSGTGDYWNGSLDEMSIWNRVLTEAEITQLYNSGVGMSYAQITGGGPTVERPLKVLTYLSASKDAQFSGSVEILGALTASIISASSDVTASGLQIVNSGTVGGDLTITGIASGSTVQGITGTFENLSASVSLTASAADIEGKLRVGGDLEVVGTFTYISSSIVDIGDKNIHLARSSSSGFDLSGGGLLLGTSSIEVDVPYTSWTYNDTNDVWESSGSENVIGIAAQHGAGFNLYKTAVEVGVTMLEALSWDDQTQQIILGGKNGFVDGYKNVFMSGALLNVSGAYLTSSIPFTVQSIENYRTGSEALADVNGEKFYSIDGILHSFDTELSSALAITEGIVSNINSGYVGRRYVYSGSLVDGTYTVDLTSNADPTYFAATEKDNVSVDVMVDDAGSWVNDLVAIKLFVESSALKLQIDAPATPTAGFRLIAVNESGSLI